MTVRSALTGFFALTLTFGCSSNNTGLPDADPFGWPECAEGQLAFGDRCVDPGGLRPCELIEATGGCPTGHYCVEGLGCIEGILCGDGERVCPIGSHCDADRGCLEGVACGDTYCAQGESCIEDRCTCTDGDPETATPDAACPDGQICVVVRQESGISIPQCVPPDYDGDGDGTPAGDVNGDGLRDDCDDLDATRGLTSPEICDSIDNDCDGEIDEGFDGDGDGYSICGYDPFSDPDCTDPELCGSDPLYGPDCDDSDPAIHPGAVDLCRLGPDGELLDPDCDRDNPEGEAPNDTCPFGSQCCAGIEGCVHTDYDPENCGGCGQRCPELFNCVVGVCRNSAGDLEIDPDEGEVIVDVEPGPAGHPDVAWNWMRRNQWFSWSERHHGDWFTFWYQYFYWELDYGIAWVRQLPGGDGLLLFNGRHFVTSWIDPIGQVAGGVSSFLDELRAVTWYGTQVIDVLDGEDTVPCLAPAGGLGYGLVWSDARGSHTQISFAAVGQYGALTGWAQQLTNYPAEHLYPRIAWGPYYYFMGSNYGLVYQRESDDDVQIYFQQVQGYWDWYQPFGAAWRVSANEGGSLSPNIAWSPFGYGVVYIGADDANLYFSLVGAFGGTLVPPIQVTSESNVAAMRPAIAWNGADGEFGIAFQATSPPADNQDIYFIRVTAFGSALASPIQLTSDPQLQRAPDMAWAGDSYGITWYDRASGENEVAFLIVDAEGSVLDGPTMITDHGGNGNAANPAITYASMTDVIDGQTFGLFGWLGGSQLGTGEYGLVWRDQATEAADPQVRFLRLTRTDE